MISKADVIVPKREGTAEVPAEPSNHPFLGAWALACPLRRDNHSGFSFSVIKRATVCLADRAAKPPFRI
jgi:hypothetical protein